MYIHTYVYICSITYTYSSLTQTRAENESSEAERLAALVPAYSDALRMSLALLDSAFVRVDLLAADGAHADDDDADAAIIGAAQHIVSQPKVPSRARAHAAISSSTSTSTSTCSCSLRHTTASALSHPCTVYLAFCTHSTANCFFIESYLFSIIIIRIPAACWLLVYCTAELLSFSAF